MPNSSKKRATKKDQLIRLLGKAPGCDIKSLSAKLGWQQHTTRAALSGLRKAGYEIAKEKPASGGISKYRILAAPASRRSSSKEVEAHGA
ncbi:hypothetical protein SuNHUV7_20470 (plasmid) [Pseudoseohaeicola sp. NH-UV-7]|jgi:hypothetical protein|uniref:DUF3489 domain-containing protein n=1 Tax=Sulfitobacter sp. TBRI5 TaxID=2989732 RepID=UPI003A77C93F